MRNVGWILFGMVVVLAACSGSGTAPATAPPTSAATSSNVPMTTSDLPTTSQATTTSTVDRVAEIEAIILDLENRRLDGVAAGDWVAWSATFANEGFMTEARAGLDQLGSIPLPRLDGISVAAVIVDSPDCVAATVDYFTTDSDGVATQNQTTTVIERRGDGSWGISFRGRGWACEGPHPFSDS
ncbi:hypothetical protein MNBD_ACTINO02-2826 [hydrothermal vent metagenome]|uniref:DUF4440 domain-containing protein n=1 Tax=hydrothermal vent metagenome TaxID=652676 RepID=A0A3B0SVR9_9ZZZZ